MLLTVGVMATLNISLPEGMKVFVESQVRKGESYTSTSDYVRAYPGRPKAESGGKIRGVTA